MPQAGDQGHPDVVTPGPTLPGESYHGEVEGSPAARAAAAVEELLTVLPKLTDDEVSGVLAPDRLIRMLTALLDPSSVTEYNNLAEFFVANKHRATTVALLRHVITHSYSFRGRGESGRSGYASPSYFQWFDDGVIVLEGEEPFTGQLVLCKNGELRYAIAMQNIPEGREVGPESVEFVSADDFSLRVHAANPPADELDLPGAKLLELLTAKCNREEEYQQVLQLHPWALGVHYRQVNAHQNLDDRNIPDFTGLKAENDSRDVIEIKPPFVKLFRRDGEFSDTFNQAWNQTERYLDFVQREADYLRRQKGLEFSNPRARLIIGYRLNSRQRESIRRKERQNPRIEVLTYDDLLAYVASTVDRIRHLAPSAMGFAGVPPGATAARGQPS